ncbi:MAG: AAA family ATPase [Chloroflexi bacterium]|nr:AAA family ATPase [Chloroflexota bacterium]
MIKLRQLRAAKFKQLDDVALSFPERGSVLIQGLNEAGKSTLFESVFFALFGKGLVTEDNAGKLDDLINYQSPRALVQLSFTTDGASFIVQRGLNRGKANTATLDVEYANGKRETVTNLTAVNRRIMDELGLDGEALLNSCFVEQKKLEKLESMTAQQRRDTLLRLLNLDKLSLLEMQYKPANADEYQLQQLRNKLKLAEIQRDLPGAVHDLSGVEAELRLIQAVRLRLQLAALQAEVVGERERQALLESDAERLSKALDEVEHVKEVRDLARTAGEMLLTIGDETAEIERLEAELGQLQGQAERLPALQAEVGRLEQLAHTLAELSAREEQQADRRRSLERLAEAVERLGTLRAGVEERQALLSSLRAEIAEAQAEVEAAEEGQRRSRQAGLLRGWLQIREVALLAQESELELGQLRQEVFELEQEAAERVADRRAKGRAAIAFGAGAVFVVAAALALLELGLRASLVGLPIAAALALGWWRSRAALRRANGAADYAQRAVGAARVGLNRREGEQALAQRTGQDPARLAEIERDMELLGLSAPSSVGEAQATLAELEVPAGPPEGGLGAERQRLGALQGRRASVEAEVRDLTVQLAQEGEPAEDRVRLAQELAGEEAAISAERTRLGSELADSADARERAAAVRAALAAATEASAKSAELVQGLNARRERLAAHTADLDGKWQQLRVSVTELERDVEACRALWKDLGEQLSKLDEPRLKRETSQIAGEVAASRERARGAERGITLCQGELDALDVPEEALASQLQALAAASGVDPTLLGAERTAADGPAAGAEDLDRRDAQLQQAQRDLLGRVAALQDRQVALEEQLGLQGVAVKHETAAEELATFEQALQIRKQAFRIVSLARRNIVAKVLPSTVRNMGLLLPLLTNDRYRDIEIDPDTYKIRVWDEAARAMKAKDIFSGGTRDQFSLALRLAFALATLPEELGTAPGFIFLDEPLSSFDTTRTGALVNLLTRGLVAANFEQIFVISHNRSFDQTLFDYHLQLEDGRIVESDLPAALTAADPEPAQMGLDLAAAR